MCFSAQASFIASGALFFIGALSIAKAKTLKNKELWRWTPLALIPIFFGIQQFVEGVLWLALKSPTTGQSLTCNIYTYLFFALIFWPLWVPISLLCLEKKQEQRTKLIITLIFGILIATNNILALVKNGASASIIANHILYSFNITSLNYYYAFTVYYIASIVPCFISSVPYMWVFGALATIAVIISYFAYMQFFTSVWCFFGAALSILIYFIISNNRK